MPSRYHKAWSEDIKPTPATVPEAFDETVELLNARPEKVSTRKKPHGGLSLGALKKRVARAGVRGKRISEIAKEIKAGPALIDPFGNDFVVLGWPKGLLRERFGRRVAKEVSRFVASYLVVRDEWPDYAAALDFSIAETMRVGRKFSVMA